MATPIDTKQGATDLAKKYGFDPNGNNETGAMFKRFASLLFPQAAQAFQFGASLEPQRENAITQLLQYLSPSSLNATRDSLQRRNTEGAASAAKSANLSNRSMGLGSGFEAGTNAGFAGEAARQNNETARQYASPEFHGQALTSILQAIEQGDHNGAFTTLMSLFGPIEQRHQQNQSEVGSGSVLGAVGNLAGAYAQSGGFGMPTPKVARGGVGSGGAGSGGFGSGSSGSGGFGGGGSFG